MLFLFSMAVKELLHGAKLSIELLAEGIKVVNFEKRVDTIAILNLQVIYPLDII